MSFSGRAAQQCNPAQAPRVRASSCVTASTPSLFSSETEFVIDLSRHKAGSSMNISTGRPADIKTNDLPADNLRHVKRDGCKKCSVCQKWTILMK
jgi:hypothetical protein